MATVFIEIAHGGQRAARSCEVPDDLLSSSSVMNDRAQDSASAEVRRLFVEAYMELFKRHVGSENA